MKTVTVEEDQCEQSERAMVFLTVKGESGEDVSKERSRKCTFSISNLQ